MSGSVVGDISLTNMLEQSQYSWVHVMHTCSHISLSHHSNRFRAFLLWITALYLPVCYIFVSVCGEGWSSGIRFFHLWCWWVMVGDRPGQLYCIGDKLASHPWWMIRLSIVVTRQLHWTCLFLYSTTLPNYQQPKGPGARTKITPASGGIFTVVFILSAAIIKLCSCNL